MLPIEQIKTSFLSAIQRHNVVILTAPPGAGKSTVLPLWLLETEFAEQKVYLLQPRRVAAKNIACYLAEQIDEPVGHTIGYRLRNDTKVSKHTKIEVITEGILTQLIQQDPELADSSLILFDEFHERSIQADLAFALARDCQLGLRDDLTLVLMSATLASDELNAQFPEAEFLVSEGRSFPVECEYHAVPTNTFWRDHAFSVIKRAMLAHRGSCLVFLPGVADIKYLNEQLSGELPADVVLSPLFGDLSLAQQQQAMRPIDGKRKLVLATNIAETSLTIEGITLVIDAGFEKIAQYDAQTLTNQLIQKPISKASAIQRAGRAGRLSAGHCIRLYAKEDFQRRPEQAVSDIQQTDLLPVLIEAARWGVSQLGELPMLELPQSVKEQAAWQELIQLKVVDSQHKLTPHGKLVASLSCHPRYANMLVRASEIAQEFKTPKLVNLACLLAAFLEERDIFSGDRAKQNCDIGLRIDFIIQQIKLGKDKHGKIVNIVKQANQLGKQLNHQWQAEITREDAGALLALAYPERIAKNRHNQSGFVAFNGKGLSMSADDPLNDAEFLVAASTIKLGSRQQVSMAASISLAQLTDWQVAEICSEEHFAYNEQKDAISATTRVMLGAIVISEKPATKKPNELQIAQMWVQKLERNGIDWLQFPEVTKQWLARVNWLANYQISLGFDNIDEKWLMANLDKWFNPFVGNITKKSALVNLDFTMMLASLFSYEQQQIIEACAPTHYVGPTGRKCPIRYQAQESPIVSLPMQEVYGLASSPQVGDIQQGNGVNLTLELLSPAGRPIQVTQDLAGFWQGSYSAVQKEMKGRYPKHFWPDDPANTMPTNKTKKHMKKCLE